MNTFWGILRYEYRMSVSRPLFLLASGILIFAQTENIWLNLGARLTWNYSEETLWQVCGSKVFELNMFMPLLAGIFMADRMVRDRQLHLIELLHSMPLTRWLYVLGKYSGALLSAISPAAVTVGIMAASWVGRGMPIRSIFVFGLAFISIAIPAYVFVTAFSLACPLFMPVRVYQVLFVGYWFWGNYLTLGIMPTLRGTWLSANGELAHQAFFRGYPEAPASWLRYTPLDAMMNLMALGFCSLIVLFVVERYMAWQRQRT
jgi:hypothetical protein